MQSATTRNVNDIAADQKRALEVILGMPLGSNQQVFILAYTPGSLPDELARSEAKRQLEQTLGKNQVFAEERGIDSGEADGAVAEAMQNLRRRP
jgi:hypothetical protein